MGSGCLVSGCLSWACELTAKVTARAATHAATRTAAYLMRHLWGVSDQAPMVEPEGARNQARNGKSAAGSPQRKQGCNGRPCSRGGLSTFSLPQRRLRRRQAGDRHAERRAAHVVQPDPVAELHRVRLAAVLAADADLQVRTRRPTLLHADLHQPADALEVDHLERVARHQVVLQVVADERAVVVAAHAETGLRQVVGAEAEELRLPGD